MPKIKSAIKRVKTSEKSHLRNISCKSKIKSSTKKFNLALSENNQEESIKYFKDTVSILDKSVNKGILPKNTASRQKSNLTRKLNTFLLKPEQINESAPAAPEKVLETQEKPVTEKPVVSKKKTDIKKTVTAKEKPVVKKATKAAKKTETKKAK